MRAVAAKVLPHQGRPGTDYVLIARASTAERPFAALVADLEGALRRIESSGTNSMQKAPHETHQARHQFGAQ
jgi:ribonuclease P protein component